MEVATRIDHEIAHGKKIAACAESIWNWDSPAGRVRANRRTELLVKYGCITARDRLLEIGCGTGLFTGKVAKLSGVSEITAIDVSPDLLEIAKGKYPQYNFMQADAMKLPFAPSSFDIVFGSSVIHHLDIRACLIELFRVLKPRGRIVFAEPNLLNPQIFIQKNIPFIKEWLGDSPDETAINRWSNAKLLKNIGYTNINITPYDFLHPITPTLLIPLVSKLGLLFESVPILKEIAGSVIISATKPN